MRYDGGDGTTGAGAEIGGGLRYAGLSKLSPAANGRGLSFSLAPGYGATASGVEHHTS